MKHNFKITLILLGMFLITQFIGLFVVGQYLPNVEQIVVEGVVQNVTTNPLPYGLEPPTEIGGGASLISILISFVIAITLILILSKYKWKFLIKGWFFIVIVLALGISLNAIFMSFGSSYFSNIVFGFPLAWLITLVLALPLAYLKIYRPNYIVHNATELFVYPGIAAIFIPILSVYTVLILLVLISIYDMWAVWHSGIMQKMAKFQMEELNIFGGFFIPYMTKKVREQIQKLRIKEKKTKKKSKQGIKVSIAILGGGDVIFPIITAGVFMAAFGIVPALFIIGGAFAGLGSLFLMSEKKKFYPAMPFISGGIFLGILLWWLILF